MTSGIAGGCASSPMRANPSSSICRARPCSRTVTGSRCRMGDGYQSRRRPSGSVGGGGGLEDGDGLALSDGRWISVTAAPERLVEVTAAHPELLLRLAWHLGNRHLPA